MVRLSAVFRRVGVGVSVFGLAASALWFADASVAAAPGALAQSAAVIPAPRAFATPPPAPVGGVVVGAALAPLEVVGPQAAPPQELLAERQARENRMREAPTSEGFDSKLSVEDASGRGERTTTFNNVDGTQSTVFSEHLVHYKDFTGKWLQIDPRVAPVKGQSGVWQTAAGDHIARFDDTFVELSTGKGRVRFAPQGVTLPTPIVSDDGLTVTYPQVWPGVDLRYRLLTDALKEEIVVTDAKSLPTDGQFLFDVSGPGLKRNENGELRIEGELGTDVLLSGVEVFDAAGLPISSPTKVFATLSGRQDIGNEKIDSLALGVDPKWVQSLPASAFPLVIDPGYYWAPFIQVAESDPASALVCATNPNCAWQHGPDS